MQTNGNICYVYEMETLGLYRSKEDKDALSNGDTIMNQIYKATSVYSVFQETSDSSALPCLWIRGVSINLPGEMCPLVQ